MRLKNQPPRGQIYYHQLFNGENFNLLAPLPEILRWKITLVNEMLVGNKKNISKL